VYLGEHVENGLDRVDLAATSGEDAEGDSGIVVTAYDQQQEKNKGVSAATTRKDRTRDMATHEDHRLQNRNILAEIMKQRTEGRGHHQTEADGNWGVLSVLVSSSRGANDKHQSESAKLHQHD